VSRPDGVENQTIALGKNSLQGPVSQQKMPTQAIWIGEGEPPVVPANLPVVFRLHGGAGSHYEGFHYLAFGSAETGWREGLPFIFKISPSKNCLNVYPHDRAWFNRSLGGPVGHFKTQAGIALHFGYNSNIYDKKAMKDGVITNYNEKRMLWLIDWVLYTLKADRNRVHATGASGGGDG